MLENDTDGATITIRLAVLAEMTSVTDGRTDSTHTRTSRWHIMRSTSTIVSQYEEVTPSCGVSLWGVVKRRAGVVGV